MQSLQQEEACRIVRATLSLARRAGSTVNPRKLEHRLRMILAGIPYTLLEGHEDNDVPTFWLLL